MAVSEAIENDLETIYILSLQQNAVHAVDICGYLSYSRVHGDTRLNAAKMAEIAERRSM